MAQPSGQHEAHTPPVTSTQQEGNKKMLLVDLGQKIINID